MKLLLPANPGGHMGRRGLAAGPSVIGWLITPTRPMTSHADALFTAYDWAIDSEIFSLGADFSIGRYLDLLRRAKNYPGRCLFATVPDVVGNAADTARLWDEWSPVMRDYGLPLAYVAQDGLTELPDVDFACLFIGGSTEYKLGSAASYLVREAKTAGKHVHMGRVNTLGRIQYAQHLGVDTVDGTGWPRSSTSAITAALSNLLSYQLQLAMEGV